MSTLDVLHVALTGALTVGLNVGLTVPSTVACRRLLAAGLFAAAAMAQAAEPAVSASNDKLRQIMGRAQAEPTAAQAGNPAVLTAKTVAPERLQERADLLARGEQALAGRDVDAALQAFDRAALILHAADTEIALVRAYMQGGEYRRALAFGAHTAGAHLDVVGGSALYAWLLHAGGQSAIAQRLLDEAQNRTSLNPQPAPTLLNRVQQELRSGMPLASGGMLALPTRLAPYGDSAGLPKTARVVGSGMLLHSGQEALVPLALVQRNGSLWLRNGLGQLATARVTQRLPAMGVARLRLGRALPVAQDLWVANRDAFPGSVGYAVEFSTAPDATPAWPVLHTGFLGAVSGAAPDNGTDGVRNGVPGGVSGTGAQRLLGIDMPNPSSSNSSRSPRGGPVFDATGRLLGMALAGPPGTPDRLVTASALPAAWGQALARSAPKDADARYGMDRVYEMSLKTALQVIALP